MAEVTKVNIVDIETQESVDNLKNLKGEIKKLKSELLGLEEGTKEYNEVLGKLSDAQFRMKDINEKSQRAMADVGEILSNVSGLAGTATQAVAGFTGVLQLMGAESEQTQKLTQNIISLMAVASSLTAIEDGIDRFKQLSIAIKVATKSVSKLKIALASTGIGLAVVAIGTLMAQLSKLSKETEEAKDEYREFNSEISDDISKFQMLQYQYNKTGNDIKKKEKFIKDNADAFKDLGIAVNSVNDADEKLIKNADKVIENIKKKTQYAILQKKYQQAVEDELNAQSEVKRLDERKEEGKLVLSPRYTNAKKAVTDAQAEQDKLLKDISTLQADINKFAEENVIVEEKKVEKLKEQTEELRTQQDIINQGLVYAETEEDVVEDTPKLDLENNDFKYENLNDDDYYNQAVATAQAVSDAEVEIAMETTEKLEAERDKRIETIKGTIDATMQIMSSTSQLFSAIQSTLDTSTKKGFEQNKKFEVAQATISYLQGLVSAWSSAMSLQPAFLIPIVGASLTALLTGVYGVNVGKIKNTQFGGTATATNAPTPNINADAVGMLSNPITNVKPTFDFNDIESLQSNQKVYVLASDIEEKLNIRKATIKNSTF